MGTIEVLGATAAVVFGLALAWFAFYAAGCWALALSMSRIMGSPPSRKDSFVAGGAVAVTVGYWVWLVSAGWALVGQ